MHGVGAVLAGWTVASGILYPVLRGVWYVAGGPALHHHRLRAVSVCAAAAGCAAVLLFAVELPYGTVTQGVVWAPAGADLRTGAEGILTRLAAAPGASLPAGSPIARFADPVLDAHIALLRAQLHEVELRYTAVEQTDRVQAQMLLRQEAYFHSELEESATRRRALDMTAPVSGRFLVNMPKDLDGNSSAAAN